MKNPYRNDDYPMTSPTRTGQQGFTLVEVMIALLIGGVVMIAVLTTFRVQHATYLAQDQVVEVQQNLRVAMDMLSREIRSAGFDPTEPPKLGAGIIEAQSDSLRFSRAWWNKTVTPPQFNLEFVRYQLYTAHANDPSRARRALGRARAVAGASLTNQAVAEYIERLEFFYLLADGSRTLTPVLDDICGVQVSLLARAANEDQGHTDTMKYFPASNPTRDEDGLFWGPFDDGFRRRLLIQTVMFRNLCLGS